MNADLLEGAGAAAGAAGAMASELFSAGQAATLLFGMAFALLVLRVPVAVALAIACVPMLALEPHLGLVVVAQETYNAFDPFLLPAVPLFLLTANLMHGGGITDRLLRLSRALVGQMPGGLAQVNVVLSLLFGGLSGSTAADAVSHGRVFLEAQRREGYDTGFSVAVTAVSSVLAVVIPPSMLMLVWGGTLGAPIGALYLASVVPGLALGLGQMALVHACATRRGYPVHAGTTWRSLLTALRESVPALMTPLIIIGGKIFGALTATEAACLAALYAAVLSGIVYRELDWRGLWVALIDTGRLTGATMFCLGSASVFGWLLVFYRVPQAILDSVAAWELGPLATSLMVAGAFLAVGCLLDAIPAIIILGSVLQPLAQRAGIDPVHFALVGIVSLALGLVLPPFGLCLMIHCAIARTRMTDVFRDAMLMVLPLMGVLLLVILWPQFTLWLPGLVSPDRLH